MHTPEDSAQRLLMIVARNTQKRRYALKISVQIQFEARDFDNDDFRLAMNEATSKGWIEEIGLMINLTESGRSEANH